MNVTETLKEQKLAREARNKARYESAVAERQKPGLLNRLREFLKKFRKA